MVKKPPNHGKAWSMEEVSRLKRLIEQNTPTRVIALKLGRTEESVYSKAQELRISLRPTNQRPFG